MDLLKTILSAQNGNAVSTIAKQLGMNEKAASDVLARVAPVLGRGLAKNTADDGLDGLMKALKVGNHQRYLEDPSLAGNDSGIADGNKILGHILGSKQVSRELASRTSAQTGVSDGLIKQMLPMIATLAMGALSKQSTAADDPNALGGMLGSLLDSDGDGSMVDDLIGMAGKFLGR